MKSEKEKKKRRRKKHPKTASKKKKATPIPNSVSIRPSLTLLIISIMILHTLPLPPLFGHLRFHANTSHPFLRRPDRFARLMLTIVISERVQRVEAVRPSTPIDPHVVAYGAEFNAVAVHFGASAAPAATAVDVGGRVGGEPPIVGALFERGGEIGEEGRGAGGCVCGGEGGGVEGVGVGGGAEEGEREREEKGT